MMKLGIIGASYLQAPLILKAKNQGIETHVFAWAANDIGETIADYFYPISIVEKEKILERCREIQIDGICTIASDLAVITVNYVGYHMGLVCNPPQSSLLSTNKYEMRKVLEKRKDPSPKSVLVKDETDSIESIIKYPVIVKPTDRSGSRGITKVCKPEDLKEAINFAKENGFHKDVLIEEFADGDEYSVECISYRGRHTMLAITKKFTTGAPHFIETGHIEPAKEKNFTYDKIEQVVKHVLDTVEIKNGASHTELKITENGMINIIEIGGRMGGDFIGSDLVELSTGIDYVQCVIDIALGKEPNTVPKYSEQTAAIQFLFSKADIEFCQKIVKEHPELIVKWEIFEDRDAEITDSSKRWGYYLLRSGDESKISKYLIVKREREDDKF